MPRVVDYYDYYKLPESSVVLPVLVLELGTIHSINLTNCRYNVISKKITKFKDLKQIDFSINELSSLPEHFAELKNLEVLNFSKNKLKTAAIMRIAIKTYALLTIFISKNSHRTL